MVRNAVKSFLAIVVVMLFSAALFAQAKTEQKPAADAKQPAAKQEAAPQANQEAAKEPNPADNYSEADRPEDNYLERFHALDICEKLVPENLEKIYTLNVITTNFKSQHADWESDYQKVYKQYKEAVDLYYRRNIIYARVRLEENRTAINKLYEKIAKAYRDDCTDLLSKCADRILELTLGGENKSSASDTSVRRSSPEVNKQIFINKMRIRIAWGEIYDGQRAVESGIPHVAIFHYRIAKGYAIRILEDLDNDKEKNKGIYDVSKADNLNRVLTAKKTTVPDTQPAAK
ncbi:MAG TPA: hypothetical protein VF857_07835 [Spirochaetota bacterium]